MSLLTQLLTEKYGEEVGREGDSIAYRGEYTRQKREEDYKEEWSRWGDERRWAKERRRNVGLQGDDMSDRRCRAGE